MKSEDIKKIKEFPKVEIDFNVKFAPLKKVQDKTTINIRYCLIRPFAFAHIYWNEKELELIYEIEEPQLNYEEKRQMEELSLAMREAINFDVYEERTQEELLDYLDNMARIISIELGLNFSYDTYRKLYYYLCRDFVGFNRVEPLLRDYFVEDIECNGANSPIYIVHRAYRNLKTTLVFEDMDELSAFVEKLAQRSGKYISYADPILDSSLPDGSRVNATYTKDITSKGPTFTIRKFTKSPWTPPQLLSFGTLSPEMFAYLWILVENKMNILIAGGTGSGKTSLLNAIGFFIPPEARVVTIEDTRELNLPRENWLPGVVRPSTQGEEGGVDLFDLLKASFRQNPDYVIVGEIRGKEAYVLFQGMASGHSSIGTIHADSVDTVIKRLETPPIELSPTLLNVLDCVCVMTHAMVGKQSTRKLKEVVEIVEVDANGVAKTNTPYVWNPSDNQFYFKKGSHIFQKISKRTGMTIEELNNEFIRRARLLNILSKNKVFSSEEVQNIILSYYKRPQEVLRRFGIQ